MSSIVESLPKGISLQVKENAGGFEYNNSYQLFMKTEFESRLIAWFTAFNISPNTLYIHNLRVATAYRGKGYGNILFKIIKEFRTKYEYTVCCTTKGQIIENHLLSKYNWKQSIAKTRGELGYYVWTHENQT